MNSIEEQIQKAQARGMFKNLKGTGRPLQLDEDNPYNQEDRLSHGLLKQAGFTLNFIDERKGLQADIALVQTVLTKAARRYNLTPLGKLRWRHATADYRQQVEVLNRRIRTYNLKAPLASFHLFMIDAEQEIERIVQAAE